MIAEHSVFREFAADRPDTADAAQLKEWSAKLKEKAERGGTVSFPGNRPYRNYSNLPMKPSADKGCQECGICASRCPVGAIPADHPNQTDAEKCITCMACVAVCPTQARALNAVALAGAKLWMKKALSGRKENELFV